MKNSIKSIYPFIKGILFLIILLGTESASSQSINGKNIAEINSEYIQIVGRQRLLTTTVNIHIDYDQKDPFTSSKKIIAVVKS